MFREDPLVRPGIVLMSVALVLMAAALLTAFILREKPEQARASQNAGGEEFTGLVRSEVSGKAPWVESAQKPGPKRPEPEPKPQSETPGPETSRPDPGRQEALPAPASDWPEPAAAEVRAASEPRRYSLPSGAILGLTVEAIGLYNAPVWGTDSQWALDNGLAHVPETSLPWSNTPQRNVYIAGHRIGYEGTRSRLIFYNLDELRKGDSVLLKDRSGREYRYEVSEVFVVGPGDSWVMGQVRGRDMVTLQTCTPIPTFDKRLIVRADRV